MIFNERFRGENNHGWRGGISPECRRINNYEWKSISKRVLERDNFACFKCGKTSENNHVHHIIPFRESKSNDMKMLITLCNRCHSKEEKKYARYGKTHFVERMLKEAEKRTGDILDVQRKS